MKLAHEATSSPTAPTNQGKLTEPALRAAE
jgi:hypothetical protein